MAKTQVVDSRENTRVPFLRGILTRSLQDAGLPFDSAYRLATRLRQELNDIAEITREQLRARVVGHLRERFEPAVVRRYQMPGGVAAAVQIVDVDGQRSPFSRSRLQRCLETCGVPPVDAASMALKTYRYLTGRGIAEVPSPHLGRLVYRWIRKDLGAEQARRFLAWVDYLHSGKPVLVFIGGTAGSGKSTIATDLANRLEIVRTQSTDMLREVMRMMIPKRLLPVLHVSSFSAWRELPGAAESGADEETLLADGYRTQAELLSVPSEAVVQRALKERVSLILEGVHMQPAFIERVPKGVDAVVVQIVLAVLKQDQLRKRIRGRGSLATQRRAERYLENFDAIWKLQAYLLSEADRAQVAIIANDDRERTGQAAMTLVVDALARSFDSSPRRVFGHRYGAAAEGAWATAQEA